MARFRLFGRASTGRSAATPHPQAPDPPTRGPAPQAGAPWPAPPPPYGGPATWAARPVPTGPPSGAARSGAASGTPPRAPHADPPTDPFGFPPIPAQRGPIPALDPAEAAALAGAFAADYLSWDEDDPERRGRVLIDYLSTPGSDPARLGWSGHGRQRAEFVLTGQVRPDGDGRVLVDVRVRVTPYRSVGERRGDKGSSAKGSGDTSGGDKPKPGESESDIAGIPAVAPAPTGRGWRSLASYWIRLSVPIVLSGGGLVVDAWEETLGEEPEQFAPAGPSVDDHTLADDDPLVEQHPGGAW